MQSRNPHSDKRLIVLRHPRPAALALAAHRFCPLSLGARTEMSKAVPGAWRSLPALPAPDAPSPAAMPATPCPAATTSGRVASGSRNAGGPSTCDIGQRNKPRVRRSVCDGCRVLCAATRVVLVWRTFMHAKQHGLPCDRQAQTGRATALSLVQKLRMNSVPRPTHLLKGCKC